MTKRRTKSLMKKELARLQEQGFLLPEPTVESLELRRRAEEFVAELPRRDNVRAIALTGSVVVGNAGKGSDIDLCVIVTSRASPLRKSHFGGVITDISEVKESDFLRDCLSGENAKYLTHTVALYDPTGFLRDTLRKAIRGYYSKKELARERDRVTRIVEERSGLGLALMQEGHLCEAAIPLESCFLEAASLLVRCYKGVASISLLLDEFFRIGRQLGRPDWETRAMRYLRLDCSRRVFQRLIDSHDRLLALMHARLNENAPLLRRMKRLRLGDPLSICGILETICAETNAQQLRDKVERALAANRRHQAGLSFLYESSGDFFMFSPFFYLKNANPQASGKEICGLGIPDLLRHWDNDVREAWRAIMRADRITRPRMIGLDCLNREVLELCR